jgi:hypothetical protein
VASSCEHSNDSLGFIKGGKFLDLLSDYQLLKVILLHGVRELCVLRAYLLIRGVSKSFRTQSITKYTLTTITLVEKQHKGLWRQNSLD